jgi:hypothetical protein
VALDSSPNIFYGKQYRFIVYKGMFITFAPCNNRQYVRLVGGMAEQQ